jgi:hypothetical protein
MTTAAGKIREEFDQRRVGARFTPLTALHLTLQRNV